MSTQNNLVQANIISSGTNKKVNKCIKFFKEDHAPSSNATSDPEIDLYNAVDKDTPYGFINQNETQECIDKKRNHLLQDDYYSSTINQEKIINMTKLPEYIHFEEEDLNVKVEEIFKELLTQPKDFFLAISKNLNDYMLKEKSGSSWNCRKNYRSSVPCAVDNAVFGFCTFCTEYWSGQARPGNRNVALCAFDYGWIRYCGGHCDAVCKLPCRWIVYR